jgi:hypothetical protein
MMGSFTGVCYDHYSSLHFALLVLQGRALASRILPVRQVRHGLKPGSGLYEGCFSAFDILCMDARSLSGSSGYTMAFGRVVVICFLSFPATTSSKIRGTGNFCSSFYQPNPNNIVALCRPSKVMFQMIRATRVQKVAMFEHFVFCVVGLSFAYKA